MSVHVPSKKNRRQSFTLFYFPFPPFYLVHVNKRLIGTKRSNGAAAFHLGGASSHWKNTCIVWKYFNIFMCILIVSRHRGEEGSGTRYAAIRMPPVSLHVHKHVNDGNIHHGCRWFIVVQDNFTNYFLKIQSRAPVLLLPQHNKRKGGRNSKGTERKQGMHFKVSPRTRREKKSWVWCEIIEVKGGPPSLVRKR